jgi:AhpD family alkylhydroperoxidase
LAYSHFLPLTQLEYSMTTSYVDLISHISAEMGQLRKEIPDTMRGFGAMAQAATKEGALDAKTKELIAAALSVAARCDPCVGFHAQALVKLGTTRAEMAETMAMAVYMGGGPSLMYAAKMSAAFDEFTAVAAAAAPATA